MTEALAVRDDPRKIAALRRQPAAPKEPSLKKLTNILIIAKIGNIINLAILEQTNAENLLNLPYGVATAQRGWLEKEHVLNTRPVDDMLAYKSSS